MRYIDNQFEWPILWRIGSGPRALRSLDDALEAVDQRLEEIEGRLVYSDEITALLGLREAVEAAAISLGSIQITTAVSALRTFAATYRPMVAIPEGDSLDALFAPILSPRRGWHSDAADA